MIFYSTKQNYSTEFKLRFVNLNWYYFKCPYKTKRLFFRICSISSL